MFGDVLSWTNLIEHNIVAGDAQPIKQHFYRVLQVKESYSYAEVDYRFQNDIAVPSSSSWASLHILIPKTRWNS